MPASDFEPVTESAPLIVEIQRRIDDAGGITFREFMEMALYHPRHGYYRSGAATTGRGDYVTSPEVHPVFGALVGRQIFELWGAMGSQETFEIVEQGAGRGVLARDIIRWAEREPRFAEALRYRIVEPSALLRGGQQRTVGEGNGRVSWSDELPDAIEGVVLSNELLDAFPVHRVVRTGDELREVFVVHDGSGFHDELRAPSTPALAGYFEELGLQPGDGCYAEVNLDAPRWMADVARSLRRGYVLTFDYGYEAADLYAPWRRDGTLLCFHDQTASSDPYRRVGRQDMTASVDFTTLRRVGERAGLITAGLSDQASFLVRMGIGEGVGAANGGDGALEEYFARRGVVLSLIDPARLGRVRVLLQAKDAPSSPPRGFRDG